VTPLSSFVGSLPLPVPLEVHHSIPEAMSQFARLFALALFAVALASDGIETPEAGNDAEKLSETDWSAEMIAAGIPAELVEATSGLDVKGLKELKAAAMAWASDEPPRVKAQEIIDEITEAADAPHDIFVGLRVFANSMQKALDADDEAALTKALGMREKFLKATGRSTTKVGELVQMLNDQAKNAIEHPDDPVNEEAAAQIEEMKLEEAAEAEKNKKYDDIAAQLGQKMKTATGEAPTDKEEL